MTTTENSRADALTEAVTHTIDTISRQLDLIAERAPGNFLDKVPVVRSLTAHKKRLEKALAPLEQHEAAPAGRRAVLTTEDVERQYRDGVHIGSGLPRATCPCGFCMKHRHGFNRGDEAIRPEPRTEGEAIYRFGNDGVCRVQAAPIEGTGNGADERAFPATDGYFVCDRAGGHVEFYDTDAERDAAHREAIAEYRRDAMHDQEWPTEVEGIVSGVVTHTTGEREIHEDSYEFEPCAVTTQARAPRTEVAAVYEELRAWQDAAGFLTPEEFVEARAAASQPAAAAPVIGENPALIEQAKLQIANLPIAERAAERERLFGTSTAQPVSTAPPAQVATRQGLTDALRQAREELAQVEWENDPPARITDLFSTIDALLDGDKR
ncbi:hypothetical protein BLA18628_07169 [Burkholderia aenigmatica]|uniref:hypothetical protein n=1 Tax=Burkholderia aenigmatica TaxID=2015348 RepID=UPI001454956D|nr:hypothetical protein [Burkholderia aenigmatica]VWD60684.1 hypothetical protein BLA18628_07169 [Burkholderia aenigmatica]